uniref:Protein CASC3 n=1 Tax=Bombyx mori TaxID=7091 RepID=A0A8R2HSE3_BOMMO|nr:protein CASC3 isoform X1 [Bombyx mori]
MTSVVRRREHDDSGEYSDASQDIEHNNSLNEGPPESDYDSQGSDSDHSERDPEAQEGERRVDDDEDRSNPQYIPKRGTFYEHDDRTAASGEESVNTTSETASEKKEGSETTTERRRPPRKSDIVNKWTHDKYNENEQMPKSRDELVAIYGYDIRNEDAPPHARRNRRYGFRHWRRGPNKYTRTWEDEEAYRRQNALPLRKPPNPEDFPELEASAKKPGRKVRAPRPRSKSQPAAGESPERAAQLRRNASIKTAKPKPPFTKTTPPKNLKPQDKKLPALETLTITAPANNNNNNNNSQGQSQRKVSAMVAQQRPVPTDINKKKPLPGQNQQPSSPAPNKSPPLQTKPQNQTSHPHPQQTTGAEPRGGSKRYSSLRQRPLAEPYTPQPQPQTQTQTPVQTSSPGAAQTQQPHRYAGQSEFTAGPAAPAPHAPHLAHQVRCTPNAPAPGHTPPPLQALPQQQQQQQQQVRLGIIDQPQQVVSHPHHPIHNIQPQPHTINQLPPAQGYAPPAMMPAQYMQQSGAAPVFGGGLFPQGAAPPYPLYPHHNYATQTGGVTYYNCAEQDQQPRAQRRPTAAIPIVKPHASERAANSTEKDNIDRIVENMFVRKPWPATHGADKEKSSEARSSQESGSKESSQPDSLTSSSISTDSRPSEAKEEKEKDSRENETEQPPEA